MIKHGDSVPSTRLGGGIDSSPRGKAKEFAVLDGDGNLIKFGERLTG